MATPQCWSNSNKPGDNNGAGRRSLTAVASRASAGSARTVGSWNWRMVGISNRCNFLEVLVTAAYPAKSLCKSPDGTNVHKVTTGLLLPRLPHTGEKGIVVPQVKPESLKNTLLPRRTVRACKLCEGCQDDSLQNKQILSHLWIDVRIGNVHRWVYGFESLMHGAYLHRFPCKERVGRVSI